MTRKISKFIAMRFMVSYLSTVSPDFYTINCFILVCFLFYKHIDDMINMIKSCQEDPFCPLLKDFAILSFFQIASILVEYVDGFSLPNNNCKHGAAQNSTRFWVDVWQPEPRTFGKREAQSRTIIS